MTAGQRHPSWCAPDHCTAYGFPDLEPYHRSQPIVYDFGDGTANFAYVFAGYVSDTSTVAVAHHDLYEFHGRRHWEVDPLDELVMPLDAAKALQHALASLVRTAAS